MYVLLSTYISAAARLICISTSTVPAGTRTRGAQGWLMAITISTRADGAPRQGAKRATGGTDRYTTLALAPAGQHSGTVPVTVPEGRYMTICELCKGAGESTIPALEGHACEACRGWGIIDDGPLPRGWVASTGKYWGIWNSIDHEIIRYRASLLEREAIAA